MIQSGDTEWPSKWQLPTDIPRPACTWFRKAVPKRLRQKLKLTISQKSLHTKDIGEAKVEFLRVAAEIEAEWAARDLEIMAATGVERPRLTHREIHALAGEFYRWLVARHEDNPGAAAKWQAEVDIERRRDDQKSKGPALRALANLATYLGEVRVFLDEQKIVIDDEDLFPLAKAAIMAGRKAKEGLAQYAETGILPEPPSYPKREMSAAGASSDGQSLDGGGTLRQVRQGIETRERHDQTLEAPAREARGAHRFDGPLEGHAKKTCGMEGRPAR